MTEMAASAEKPQNHVVFRGRRLDLAKIAIVNTLLMSVTLSIYRFWAKTRIRQFYWQRIEIDGDPLEYTGRGMELFLGFLIVVAIFIPISLGITAAQTLFFAISPEFAQLPQLAMFVVIWWLFGYAIYRARRYRLSRTLWRGIRFGQDGSPARYAWLRFGWSLLVVLTLGLAMPWCHVALRRYEMTNTRFGFSEFDYAGRGRELLRYWWPVMLTGFIGLSAYGGVMFRAHQIGVLKVGTPPDFELRAQVPFSAIAGDGLSIVLILTVLAMFPAFFLMFARYRVSSLRYLFSVSSLKGIACRSGAKTRRVLIYMTVLFGMFLVTYGLIVGYFVGLGALAESGQFPVLAGFMIFPIVIVLFLVLSIARQVFFVFPLTRHVIATLETSDMAALKDVVQGTRDDPRFGEGLLDALDVDLDVM